MDLTQGDDSAFSEGTIQEVLSITKERLRADLKEAVIREQEGRRAAESQRQQYEEEQAIRVARLGARANKWAQNVRRVVLWICVTVLLVSSGYTFPWSLPRPIDVPGKYLLSLGLLFLMLLSIGNLAWGVTLRTLIDKLEKRIESWLRKQFLRFAGFDKDEPKGSTEKK
jgi:hypothetical protein